MALPVYTPNARRDADAVLIARGAGQWLHITLREDRGVFRAGERFYGVPSSQDNGSYYTTNFRFCSCGDYENRGQGCKHQRAVLLHVAAKLQEREQEGSADKADPTLAITDPDGSRAYLAKLKIQRAGAVVLAQASGNDPQADGDVAKLDEWIERLEARVTRQDAERDREPVAAGSRRGYRDLLADHDFD